MWFGSLIRTVDALNSLPDGSVILTFTQSYNGPNSSPPGYGSSEWLAVRCPASIPLAGLSNGRNRDGPSSSGGNGPGSSAAMPVWQTDIPGIHVRMKMSFNGVNPLAPGSTIRANARNVIDGWMYYFRDSYSVTFDIIKSGRVAPGSQWLSSNGSSYWIGFNVDGLWTAGVLLTGSIDVYGSSCKLADANVAMGTWRSADFTGSGSTTPPVNFALQFSGCSSVDKITWKVDSISGNVDAKNGVFKLNATSTASGVALQLKDALGKVVALGENRVLNTAKAASPSIPLQLSYIQTGASVLPGSADGRLMVTVIYN